MNKSKRRRIPAKRLEMESQWVRQFCFEHLERAQVRGVHTQTLYKAYQKELAKAGLETELSIDGFGRLLPKIAVRKVLSLGGDLASGFVGMRLV